MTAFLLGFALAFAGFTLIAATMDRHQDDLAPRGLAPRPALAIRLAGFALLGLAMLPGLRLYGTSIGLAWWCGVLTFAALALALLLTYRPRQRP